MVHHQGTPSHDGNLSGGKITALERYYLSGGIPEKVHAPHRYTPSEELKKPEGFRLPVSYRY